MNYVYDIYLNLNEVLYDFFDWNKNDKLNHIKKIPIVKIEEESIRKIINYKIRIDEEFLSKINGKTEVWNVDEKLQFCCLFTDGNDIIATEFNKCGISTRKSMLFIDEELEVLEIINKLSYKTINFKIIKKEKKLFKTRDEIKKEKFIDNELKNIELNKLGYIYFECFGKHDNDRKRILENIKKLPKNGKAYKNLYNILKLTSQTPK